jgi:hypothetical protein
MRYTDELLDERIRSAVPDYDDSNWGDVRRRARRKALPAALAGTFIVAVLLAAPAFALRHQIADLWKEASPQTNQYVVAFARCGQGSFSVEFDPVRGAAAKQGGQTLATASLSDRQIECDAPIRTFKSTPDGSPWHGELTARSYEATTVTCETNAALEVAVNPIWNEYGKIVGSALLVADRNTRQVIASAVFDSPASSRTYWMESICSARG